MLSFFQEKNFLLLISYIISDSRIQNCSYLYISPQELPNSVEQNIIHHIYKQNYVKTNFFLLCTVGFYG